VKIRFLRSAVEDLANGHRFYHQHGAEAAAYFMDSLFSDLDTLARNGGTHRKCFGYHRMLAKRFPFAIYYTVADDLVEV
jgi:plasmid stabilization system protein ParE